MDTDPEITGDICNHPDVRAIITQLIDGLTGPDAHRRRAMARWIRDIALPPVRAEVVRLLADRLGAGGKEDQDRVAAALRGIGPAALLSLVVRLPEATCPMVRDRLVEVVAGIGRALPPPDKHGLFTKLLLAMMVAPEEESARTVARVLARLRDDVPASVPEDPATVDLMMAFSARGFRDRRMQAAAASTAKSGPASEGSTSRQPRARRKGRRGPGRRAGTQADDAALDEG